MQLTNLVLLELISKKDIASLQQKIKRIPLLKYEYLGSFPSDYVSLLPPETFAIINTQPNKLQGEHRILIVRSRHQMNFADSLAGQKYSFLKKQYKLIMRKFKQTQPTFYGFYTTNAAFHDF